MDITQNFYNNLATQTGFYQPIVVAKKDRRYS